MGNFLSFASVTSTISYILEEVNRDVSGIKITTKPLDAIDLQNPVNGLNIFLYLVTPTSSVDAIDTLVRDNQGQPTNNPILSLDLHYIITATSTENEDLVAQKILASAMRILNNHPVLLQDLIRKAIKGKEGLESSDLADQVDNIRLTLNALSIEDLTKIWARFPNANFRPSVAYVAQVILLESKIIEPPGFIGSVGLDKIGQLKSPAIESIEPRILEYAPDASIVILGNSLNAPSVSVGFNDNLDQKVNGGSVSDRRAVVPIPAEIEPGIQKVSINHYLGPQKDEQAFGKRSVLKSNAYPFVLAPRILSPRQGKVAKGKELTIDFEPPVSKEKTVFAYLGDMAIPATHVKGPKASGDSKVGSVKLIVPADTAPGVYLLRVAVDGATSILVRDENPRSPTFKKSVGPYIEVV
ncbi:MAG TPA: DUF4255 domain-containing protein [Nitrososphaera sp.]|nr:DUF4255 domain-containing protein [Nitrososphaera sp.]